MIWNFKQNQPITRLIGLVFNNILRIHLKEYKFTFKPTTPFNFRKSSLNT